MRVCLEDNCLIDGIALPKWFHVCPVCKHHTYDLDEIERAMQETPIPIELVDSYDLNRMLEMLRSNQENWDEEEWKFIDYLEQKYIDRERCK